MQMYNQPYYTIKASLFAQQGDTLSIAATKSINFNIFLNKKEELQPSLFLKAGLLTSKYTLSISSDLINTNEQIITILPKLFVLVSLNKFSSGQPLVMPIFLGDSGSPSSTTLEIIINYFKGQGIEKIQLPLFEYHQTKNHIQDTPYCSLISFNPLLQENVQQFLDTGFTKNKFSGKIIISFGNDNMEHNLQLDTINQIEDYLKTNSKFFFYNSNVAELNYIEEKELWKKRALLYQSFLRLSKTVQEKEYYEVLNWYHTEYETLPLWYKRLGHIIKAIMGKRSFRSLFNDNIKKNKD